jgi:hypothetical protein
MKTCCKPALTGFSGFDFVPARAIHQPQCVDAFRMPKTDFPVMSGLRKKAGIPRVIFMRPFVTRYADAR